VRSAGAARRCGRGYRDQLVARRCSTTLRRIATSNRHARAAGGWLATRRSRRCAVAHSERGMEAGGERVMEAHHVGALVPEAAIVDRGPAPTPPADEQRHYRRGTGIRSRPPTEATPARRRSVPPRRRPPRGRDVTGAGCCPGADAGWGSPVHSEREPASAAPETPRRGPPNRKRRRNETRGGDEDRAGRGDDRSTRGPGDHPEPAPFLPVCAA
jgi:hypothetical protein